MSEEKVCDCPSDKDEEYTQDEIAELVAIASHIQSRPEEMQGIMRREGLKIGNLDDPMQKLAFTLYTELCSLDSLVKDFFEKHDERNQSRRKITLDNEM